jgi:hypothetical protein
MTEPCDSSRRVPRGNWWTARDLQPTSSSARGPFLTYYGRNVLAAAIKSRAQVLASNDLGDFAQCPGGIVEAEHPGEFVLDQIGPDRHARNGEFQRIADSHPSPVSPSATCSGYSSEIGLSGRAAALHA